MTNELEDKDCIITFKQTEAKLIAIDKQLAQQLNMEGDMRSALMMLDRMWLLIEDELVADWHDAYASWLK